MKIFALIVITFFFIQRGFSQSNSYYLLFVPTYNTEQDISKTYYSQIYYCKSISWPDKAPLERFSAYLLSNYDFEGYWHPLTEANSAIEQYATREEAEKAIQNQRSFGDKQVIQTSFTVNSCQPVNSSALKKSSIELSKESIPSGNSEESNANTYSSSTNSSTSKKSSIQLGKESMAAGNPDEAIEYYKEAMANGENTQEALNGWNEAGKVQRARETQNYNNLVNAGNVAANQIQNENYVGAGVTYGTELANQGYKEVGIAVVGLGVGAQLINDNQKRKAEEAKAAAEEERLEEIRIENARIEKERLAMLERQRLAKIKAQADFMTLLIDHRMPVLVQSKSNYFFFVSVQSNEMVYLSDFELQTNSSNELPYKVDLVKLYKQTHEGEKVYLYGPFTSEAELDKNIDNLNIMAFNSYVTVSEKFFYPQVITRNSAQSSDSPEYDARGNLIENKSKTTQSIGGAAKTVTVENAKEYDVRGNLIKSKSNKTIKKEITENGTKTTTTTTKVVPQYDVRGNRIN